MRMLARTRNGLLTALSANCLLTLTLLLTVSAQAQSGRDQVPGVHNFGKVTDSYFRGGEVTPEGVDQLRGMGVLTIIDLRDEVSVGEAEACEKNGIRYIKIPMNGHETPNDQTIDRILALIQEAKDPIYVHCSGGKHRAGTVAALYRMRVQGWSKDRAWAEQQSYGFGLPEEHPRLYAYSYDSKQSRPSNERLPQTSTVAVVATADEDRDNEGNDRESGRERDDESDEAKARIRDKEREKERKAAKALKKQEEKALKASRKKDDDDEEDGDKDGDTNRTRHTQSVSEKPAVEETSREIARAEVKTPTTATTVDEKRNETAPASVSALTSLVPNGEYMALGDAIIRARTEGGTGDVLKIDLEWDPARALATWDVTFSSGDEYELDASSGKLLAKKNKSGPKLNVLLPLSLEGSSKMKMLSFQEIIARAEAARNQRVLEMELKRIKGRSETVFEVAFADGMTLYFDAATGQLLGV